MTRDLGEIFDGHTGAEFETRDIDATMATISEQPSVTHVPVMAGGYGPEAVRAKHVLHKAALDQKREMIPSRFSNAGLPPLRDQQQRSHNFCGSSHRLRCVSCLAKSAQGTISIRWSRYPSRLKVSTRSASFFSPASLAWAKTRRSPRPLRKSKSQLALADLSSGTRSSIVGNIFGRGCPRKYSVKTTGGRSYA
jgi:hypothetical protein